MSARQGLVQVYTGDGKGKTTAAMGLALRAAGHNLHTLIIQFIKTQESGEDEAIRWLGARVRIVKCGAGFVFAGRQPSHRAAARQAMDMAWRAVTEGKYDIIILDEVNCAVALGLVEIDELMELISARPPHVELILTGRDADPKLLDVADLVTIMQQIKHPYNRGIVARQGIEY